MKISEDMPYLYCIYDKILLKDYVKYRNNKLSMIIFVHHGELNHIIILLTLVVDFHLMENVR